MNSNTGSITSNDLMKDFNFWTHLCYSDQLGRSSKNLFKFCRQKFSFVTVTNISERFLLTEVNLFGMDYSIKFSDKFCRKIAQKAGKYTVFHI